MKFLLLLLLACTTGYSQIDLEKDTLLLDEVTVLQKNKFRVKKIKYRSSCTFLESFTSSTEVVTLVDELSEGYLRSIKFNFNNYISSHDDLYKLEDTELELVLYEVNSDSTPGKAYSQFIRKFIVKKEDKGPMEIDLSAYKIYYPGKLFIGLRALDKSDHKARKIEVDGICNANDQYLSYFKTDSNLWKTHNHISALSMEIKVAVLK